MFKKILFVFGIIVILLVSLNFNLVLYGLSQAKGQLKIVIAAKPVEAYLKNPDFPDSLKQKLLLIKEVKKYAFDSLGIKFSENYSTMYDQHGVPSMWVVTACDPYKLEAKEWHFPFIGSFSYKGFFDPDKAEKLEKSLKEEGYDTDIRNAGGWSTLGWFKDPILSNMLNYSEPLLCDLIIHELTHGTLFVKDSLKFNENLASFIGNKGTERFLKDKYGEGAQILKDFMNYSTDKNTINSHILRGADYLDSLYNVMDKDMSRDNKETIKKEAIHRIISSMDTLTLSNKEKYHRLFDDFAPNNTFFMSYQRYRGDYELLEKEYEEKYKGNIKSMLADYKSRFPSL